MRIIGGSARGRTLKTPVGQDIRPTSDKVRLAIFNALYSRGGVVDKVVLDAFCGTGALGCEALSQGAAKSIFCDISRQSLALAKENAAALGFEDRAEFILKDAAKLPPFIPSPLRGEGQGGGEMKKIDIVFLDPPYRKNLITPTLEALKSGNWITESTIIVIETEKETPLVEGYGDIVFDKTYGETRVSFLKI
jgi:16S rRNA (guanine966-N2)-methyltransferase